MDELVTADLMEELLGRYRAAYVQQLTCARGFGCTWAPQH